MKKIFKFFLLILCGYGQLMAQSIAPTGGSDPCLSCAPPSWTSTGVISHVSTLTNVGGFNSLKWLEYGSNNPGPVLPPPSGASTFLTIVTQANQPTNQPHEVSTMVTGLTAGHVYTLTSEIMSARVGNFAGSPPTFGTYAADILIKVDDGVVTKHVLVPADEWNNYSITWTATDTDAKISFVVPVTPSTKTGAINIDVAQNAITDLCKAGTNEVTLQGNTVQATCPTNTADITPFVIGQAPSGTSVVWYSDPEHSAGKEVADPHKVTGGQVGRKYYAFYWDAGLNCFNTNNSIAEVFVQPAPLCDPTPCLAGTDQVWLGTEKIFANCPDSLGNLNKAEIDQKPLGVIIRWFDNPYHTGQWIEDITAVKPGTYYVFYYDPLSDCYNTAESHAVVTVEVNCPCAAEGTTVAVSGSLVNECPKLTVDLNKAAVNTPPNGTELVWFNNPSHSGSPIADATAVGAGVYYAFYYDPIMKCYNTENSTAQVVAVIMDCVDLTPVLDIDDADFTETAERDFIVRIKELNGSSTFSEVKFSVTKPSGFDITYNFFNGSSNVSGGIQNQNSNWQFSENNKLITITSKPGIVVAGKGEAIIGFHIKRKNGVPFNTIQNVTPTIVAGAGGDINSKNNNTVTNLITTK
ncbi:hypothetical protein FEM33_04870 [Dyadobacter flavalbus]|uniref:Uncharacterized protein n=1 Tax=Dyadobacter flavalbus TaxID=2579942 RepID=A0A5M8QX19_9BACT|nr:hypothetical protein [Dyadobacter flavalbus]KAA6440865.1 hypothetical protein FEM33_04870 [Dyadobacter flavalbus]